MSTNDFLQGVHAIISSIIPNIEKRIEVIKIITKIMENHKNKHKQHDLDKVNLNEVKKQISSI